MLPVQKAVLRAVFAFRDAGSEKESAGFAGFGRIETGSWWAEMKQQHNFNSITTNRTLIVLDSEFSRDMLVEGRPGETVKHQVKVPDVIEEEKHYEMHRHFTGAGSILLFGGGIKKGFLYGETPDERPCNLVDRPVTIENLHATLYHAMGISPKLSYEIEKKALLRHQRRHGNTNRGPLRMTGIGQAFFIPPSKRFAPFPVTGWSCLVVSIRSPVYWLHSPRRKIRSRPSTRSSFTGLHLGLASIADLSQS
jgi:uncharacterized protein DUF1501